MLPRGLVPLTVVVATLAASHLRGGEEPSTERGTVCVFEAGNADVKFWKGTPFPAFVENVKRNPPRAADREEWKRHCDGLVRALAGCRILFVDVVETAIVDERLVTRFADRRKPVAILIRFDSSAGRENDPKASPFPDYRLTARVVQVITDAGVRKIMLEFKAEIPIDDDQTNAASTTAVLEINAAKGIKTFGIEP